MIKDKLRKITEKAKIKSLFTEDLKEFATVILKNWTTRCAESANEGENECILTAFRADAFYANNKICFFLKNGLTEFLKKETELDIKVQEFIIKMSTKELVEVKNPQFDTLFKDDNFLHYFVIKLSWE